MDDLRVQAAGAETIAVTGHRQQRGAEVVERFIDRSERRMLGVAQDFEARHPSFEAECLAQDIMPAHIEEADSAAHDE